MVKNFWHYSNDNVYSCVILNWDCWVSDYYLAYRWVRRISLKWFYALEENQGIVELNENDREKIAKEWLAEIFEFVKS